MIAAPDKFGAAFYFGLKNDKAVLVKM